MRYGCKLCMFWRQTVPSEVFVIGASLARVVSSLTHTISRNVWLGTHFCKFCRLILSSYGSIHVTIRGRYFSDVLDQRPSPLPPPLASCLVNAFSAIATRVTPYKSFRTPSCSFLDERTRGGYEEPQTLVVKGDGRALTRPRWL